MSPRRKISVVVADQYPVVLEGLRAALSKKENINILGAITTGEKCLELIANKKPDVALIDMKLPDIKGDEIIKKSKSKGISTKFIVLSDEEDHDYVHNSIKAGVNGFILKNSSVEDIVKAIEKVYSGGTFFSEKISQILVNNYLRASETEHNPLEVLSEREVQILKMIADGLTTKDIANQLGISPRTVDTHRERIMAKLNIHNIAGLTKYAIKYRITGV